MKIKTEHLVTMHNAITKYLEQYPGVIERYEHGVFPRSDAVKDLQTRFNFDMLDHSGLTQFVCTNIYTYANDNHIATALKSICPKIVRRY